MYSRLKKISCGIKDQVRSVSPCEKCGLVLRQGCIDRLGTTVVFRNKAQYAAIHCEMCLAMNTDWPAEPINTTLTEYYIPANKQIIEMVCKYNQNQTVSVLIPA